MLGSERKHWQAKLLKYASEEWAEKPSLFAEFVINHLPSQGKLLELGSGSGQDSAWFATKGYEVIQSDAVDVAFKRTHELAAKWQVNLEQRIVDLNDPLPFEDNSLDVVYAQLCLHYFDEAQTHKVFAEIYRVLKPGGVLASLFNSTSDPQYGAGTKIEDDYFQIEKLRKRFFSTNTLKKYVGPFNVELIDDQGETYKDKAEGVTNLIRLIAKKQ